MARFSAFRKQMFTDSDSRRTDDTARTGHAPIDAVSDIGDRI
jgi:hypothetical protein